MQRKSKLKVKWSEIKKNKENAWTDIEKNNKLINK